MGSSRKYPAYAPSLPTEGNGNSGGGGSKRSQFPRIVGWLQSFFPGRLSKIGDLLIKNSLSAEQAISYYTVTGVALIIFYLRSAKCFFHGYATVFIDTMSSAHE